LLSFLIVAVLYVCFSWIGRASSSTAEIETILPGLTLDKELSSEPGLVVTSVRYDSQAKQQGIAVGDEILSINGIPARPGERRSHYLANPGPRTIRLDLLHDGLLRTITLDLGQDNSHGSEDPAHRG